MTIAVLPERLHQLAKRSPGREICGLVDSAGDIYPIKNVAKNNEHFVMERREYFSTLSRIEKSGRTVWCVYHSHLGTDPTPSPQDTASMEACKVSFMIVTTMNLSYRLVLYDTDTCL